MNEKTKERMVLLLKWLFGASLCARYLLPFYMNPMQRLFSDFARHWHNGLHFPTAHLMGGVDPKLYQVWVWALSHLSKHDPALIACFTGLLSAAMPYIWYRAFRELFDRPLALCLGIFFAILPSFALIYAFFMNETLLLALIGLALWLTLRAYRKRRTRDFVWASFVWVLCACTRLSGVPLAVMFIGFLWWYLPSRKTTGAIAASFFALAIGLTGWHSYRALNVFAPFHFVSLNEIYYYSDTKAFGIDMADGPQYTWSMSSFYTNPLDPIYDYKSFRKEGQQRVSIDLSKGMQTWRDALAPLKAAYGFERMLHNMRDNVVFFTFGPPWPDSGKDSDNALLRFNYHARWMWPPIIFIFLLSAPFYRSKPPHNMIVWGTWLLIIAAFFQHSGVMEARFRKPLDPLILLGLVLIVRQWVAKFNAKRLLAHTQA